MQTKEERKEYHRQWRHRNKDKWNSYSRKWYGENSEKRSISRDRWEAKHRKERKLYIKQWGIDNKKRLADTQRKLLLGYKTQVVEAYGGKCSCCGEKEIGFLTVEHLTKNGMQHRKVIGNFYRWLINNKFPKKGLSILCMNCNWIERNGRICPHRNKEASA